MIRENPLGAFIGGGAGAAIIAGLCVAATAGGCLIPIAIGGALGAGIGYGLANVGRTSPTGYVNSMLGGALWAAPGLKVAKPFGNLSATHGAAAAGAATLKGTIADQVPCNLAEQMAMDAAKSGVGKEIITNLADAPRLRAIYGEGEWVKMQANAVAKYNRGDTASVHYFLNKTTGSAVEFKFK